MSRTHKDNIAELLYQLDCIQEIRVALPDESPEKRAALLELKPPTLVNELEKFHNKEAGYDTDFLAVQLPVWVRNLDTRNESWSILGYEHLLVTKEDVEYYMYVFDPQSGDRYGIMLLFIPRTIVTEENFEKNGTLKSKTLTEIYDDGKAHTFPYYWMPMARNVAAVANVSKAELYDTPLSTALALTTIRVVLESETQTTKLNSLDYDGNILSKFTATFLREIEDPRNKATFKRLVPILKDEIQAASDATEKKAQRLVGLYTINPQSSSNLSQAECYRMNCLVMRDNATMSNRFSIEFSRLISGGVYDEGTPKFSSTQLSEIFKDSMSGRYIVSKEKTSPSGGLSSPAVAALWTLNVFSAETTKKGLDEKSHLVRLPGVDLFNTEEKRFLFMNGSVHEYANVMCRRWDYVQTRGKRAIDMTHKSDAENRVLRFPETELPKNFPQEYLMCASSLVSSARRFNHLMQILLKNSEIDSNRSEAVEVVLRQYATAFSSTKTLLRDLLHSCSEVIDHAVRAQHHSELIPRPQRSNTHIKEFIKQKGVDAQQETTKEELFEEFERWRGFAAYVWLKHHFYSDGEWSFPSMPAAGADANPSESLRREAFGFYLDQTFDTKHLYLRKFKSEHEAAAYTGDDDGAGGGYASDSSSTSRVTAVDLVRYLPAAAIVPETMLKEVGAIFQDFTKSSTSMTTKRMVSLLDGYEARHCLISSLLLAFRERIVFMASVFATALGADRSRLAAYLRQEDHLRVKTHDSIQDLFHVVLEEKRGDPSSIFTEAARAPSTIREANDALYYDTVVPDLRNIIADVEKRFLLNCSPNTASSSVKLKEEYNYIALYLKELADLSVATESASYPAASSEDFDLLSRSS